MRSTEAVTDAIGDPYIIIDVEMEMLQVGEPLMMVDIL